MSTELPDKLLNIDGKGADDRDPEPDDEGEDEEKARFVVFRIGGTEYGLEVEQVLSVVESDEYTRLPRSSEAIDGLIDLRGSITAVIDLRIYLDTQNRETEDQDSRVIVLDRPGDQQGAGLRVDEVLGVESIPVSSIFQKPSPDADVDATALSHALVKAVIAPAESNRDKQVSLIDLEGVIQTASSS
jgi:purine-binding chemotaxis protein CheW